MSSTAIKRKSKRVRLGGKGHTPAGSLKSQEARNKARDKAFREAPRLPNGRIIPGWRYKSLLDAHTSFGSDPKQIEAFRKKDSTRLPMFKQHPEKGKKFISLITEGYPYTTVCRYMGVTRETFIGWLERGKTGEYPYDVFFRRVQRAEARAEMKRLKELRKHRKSEWKVSAWELERRFPEHWSRIDRTKAELHISGELSHKGKIDLGNRVVSDSDSRELARRIIDGDYKDITPKKVEDTN